MENPFEQILSELTEIKEKLASPTTQEPPEIIDRKELQKRLQLSEMQIMRLVKRKVIPEIKLASSCRYNWPEVVKRISKLPK